MSEPPLKFCIFAGTTEGRALAELLRLQQGTDVTVCVATQYGETLLSPAEGLRVRTGRMTAEEMTALLRAERFALVLDATHPYAAQATENIAAACAQTGTDCLRVLREDSARADGAVYVPDLPAAAAYLDCHAGNILLTTGSKELQQFAGIRDFASRVWARVLPMEASLESCRTAGLPPAHILAMQGPFSEELNVALLRAIDAKFLVTKDGGRAGGFAEKAAAAARTGAALLVIGRPAPRLSGREALTLADTVAYLRERFGLALLPAVTVAGIGPGGTAAMTGEVREAIAEADCLIGARRMLEAAAAPGQTVFAAVDPEKICAYLRSHGAFQRVTVLMSGDTGFYSGCKKLLPLLRPQAASVRVLPGLSSLSYLCAKLGTSWEDAVTVSLHGRARDIVSDVRAHAKVFVLVGDENGAGALCRRLTEAGYGQVSVSVGERLSYPDERVTTGPAAALAEERFDRLSAVLITRDRTGAAAPEAEAAGTAEPEAGSGGAVASQAEADGTAKPEVEADGTAEATRATEPELAAEAVNAMELAAATAAVPASALEEPLVTPGLPDAAFLRSESVPMTKSEVRAVCLSKLRLTLRAVCWDIGAGTGSVSVEMAALARKGRVYAVERNPAALELLRANAARHGRDNLVPVHGTAPEACAALPTPTHVFLGGSGGALRETVALALKKNPAVRIVATAVTLESIAALTACEKAFPFTETEAVSLTVARDRRAGPYHLMTGQNPVYIFTMQGAGEHTGEQTAAVL